MQRFYNACKNNKGLLIYTVIFMVVSLCLTTIISAKVSYNNNVIAMGGYFARLLIKCIVCVTLFIITFFYGKKLIYKYPLVLVLIGIFVNIVCDNIGYINVFGYGIEIQPFSYVIGLLGLSVCFVKYAVKTSSGALIYIAVLLGINYINSSSLITITAFAFSLFLFSYAVIKRLFKNKLTVLLNAIPIIMLGFSSFDYIINGIVGYFNNYYETGYMAYISREVLKAVVPFGGMDSIIASGEVANYKLLWIFDCFGWIVGVTVAVMLTIFVALLVIKSICKIKSEEQPFLMVIPIVLVIRYIISMLANFGIVLYGISAPIPILSDGLCGYAVVAIFMGLIISSCEEKCYEIK